MNRLTYEVAFKRIGRNHDVAPLTATVLDADDLADQIFRYARPHLASRDVEVVVDLEAMTGHIFCGMNNGGTFTVSAVSP